MVRREVMSKVYDKAMGLMNGAHRRAGVLALPVCLLVCSLSAPAQQASTPARQKPTATTAPPSKQTQPTARKKTDATLPVVAVVHRLSGWRLRSLLMRPGAPVAATFDEQFTRTNIVAGYVLADGRSVVARLPRADAEMLDLYAQFPDDDDGPGSTEAAPLTLLRGDGTEFKAHFVGLDASTGLSLLEAEHAFAPPTSERAPFAPAIGQRVRVVAPVPAGPPANLVTIMTLPRPAPPAAVAATVAAPPAAIDGAPTGEAGMIYMSMSEAQGQLKQIKRSPTGKPVEFTVELGQVSPEWTGGVAFGETGALVGIVDESATNEARLVAAGTVRAAAARVQARRASVPQPWLGARGDAVAMTPLRTFLTRGWPEREARALVSKQQGVLLTDVAPGTPAALAGLRSGDVVARISQHDVRNVEEMTQLIQELGSNTIAKFTVLRAQAPPLDLSVRLSEARNPALETAQAEASAAEADIRTAQTEAKKEEIEARSLEAEARGAEAELRMQEAAARMADAEHRDTATRRLRAAQAREEAARARLATAQARFNAARERMTNAQQRFAEAGARMKAALAAQLDLPLPTLLAYGLEAKRVAPQTAQGASAPAGLVVMSVHPQSAAAEAGVRVGDIIETIEERRIVTKHDVHGTAQTRIEATCMLNILRDGQRLILKLTNDMPKN